MNKLLVIVDMQNDFITGSLANKDAEAIVPKIVKFLKEWDWDVIVTRDTHQENYLETQEGKNLPIKHCIEYTDGWEINRDILMAMPVSKSSIIDKPTFGSLGWITCANDYGEIYLCGTCTDICVVSNALIIKACAPEVKVKVLKDLCAGVTKEKHEAALEVMRSCQVEVI